MTDIADKPAPGLDDVVEALCRPESWGPVYHRQPRDVAMPSVEAVREAVELLRAVIFPGYFGASEVTPQTMRYSLGSALDKAHRILAEQIKRGKCFACSDATAVSCSECETSAKDVASVFLASLPELRRLCASDVQAAYEGDPAAKTPGETIFCYPSILAVTNQRIGHALYDLGVALIPRIITELAHSATGIDIHPGAAIGERFFIDHGTGVVIGETSVIGKNVRLYQGVTLGAKSFPTDEEGKPIKGIPRHPVVEDDVTIYAGATILGRVTIGRGATIGGNVWLTQDAPPGATVLQSKTEARFINGGG